MENILKINNTYDVSLLHEGTSFIDNYSYIIPIYRKIINGNDVVHRIDGPAVIWGDGCNEWYFNGMLHCDTGPAIINGKDGTKYFIHGRERTEEEFLEYKIQALLNEL